MHTHRILRRAVRDVRPHSLSTSGLPSTFPAHAACRQLSAHSRGAAPSTRSRATGIISELAIDPRDVNLGGVSGLWEQLRSKIPHGFGEFGKKDGAASGEKKDEPADSSADKGKDKKADKEGEGIGWGNKDKKKKKGGNFDPDDMDPTVLLVSGAIGLYLLYSLLSSRAPRGAEVSWQEFRNTYLATGMVDRLEVVNKEYVTVALRNTPNFAFLEGEAAAAGGGSAAAAAFSAGKNVDPAALFADGAVPPDREADLRRAMEDARAHKAVFFRIGSVESFERQLEDAQIDLRVRPRDFVLVRHVTEADFGSRFGGVLPYLVMFAVYAGFFRMMGGGAGGGLGGGGGPGGINRMFGIGKAKPTVINKDSKVKVTFKDVAGCDEAKQEIVEFVQFLRDPSKFTALGAKIPKGALLVGPPGTGKTLLAKATAGEASVPFFSMSGSDFIEMFVGVGPSRVRDLFAQARAAAPSIIFIDEIDAVARSRNKGGFSGGNDERENTLNQLLVEMDGFASTEGVVVLAGTNRADILDKAILRPGRFDRQIQVDKPDIKGRKQIFQVHMDKVKIAGEKEAYSQRLAALTPGFVGADIANICNEAAIHAARGSKEKVDLRDFEAAIDRVIGGLERRNSLMTPDEKRTVAFHEAGHAIAGWFLEHADPLLKVTIIPRGKGALGFAQYLPKEVTLFSREALVDRMCMALGGRASEELNFGRITTGASDDLDKVTQMAYAMTTVYGMNSRVGNLSFRREENQFDKPYSEATAQVIDEEVRKLVDDCYARTKALLDAHADKVKAVAELLLERETISQRDLEALAGQRPYPVNEGLKQYVHSMFDDSEDAKPKEADKDGKKKEGEEKEAAGADGPIPAAACAGDVKLR